MCRSQSLKFKVLAVFIFVLLMVSPSMAAVSVNDAINYAEGKIGSNWDSQCGHAWAYWCMHFCGHAYGKVPSNVTSAIAGWESSKYDNVFGPKHYPNEPIPRGSLVFFGTSLYKDGHVGLYIGSGRMIHAWTTGVREDNVSRFASHYVGWRWPKAWTTDTEGGGGGGQPDIIIRDLYLTDHRTSFYSCESGFKFYARVKNEGDADAGHDIHIKYSLSTGWTSDDNVGKSDLEKGESVSKDESASIPTTPGTYTATVCADSSNEVSEENESNNCSSLSFQVSACNQPPKGSLDSASCEIISGWSKDPDTSSSIGVDFYMDAPVGSGGTFIGAVTANQYRSDVGNYAYSFSTPEQLKDGKIHYVYAYGIDSAGGHNPQIGMASVLCVPHPPNASPVYRFWSDQLEAHFYTISEEEKSIVINTMPAWRYEKVAWYSYPTQQPGTLPVYRFWNNDLQAHFYTISEEEKEYIPVVWPSWKYEKIAWYAFPNQLPGTSPVYRFWYPAAGSHFYTASEEDKNLVLTTMPVWQYEGIAWYIQTDPYAAVPGTLSPPTPSFTADVIEGTAPFSVNFTDTSASTTTRDNATRGNITSREWDFGDYSGGTDTNLLHTYSSPGRYPVTLTVRGPDGENTLKRESYIIVNPPNLPDVIKCLQVLAGLNPSGITVRNGEKIGMDRVILMLQMISGVRK